MIPGWTVTLGEITDHQRTTQRYFSSNRVRSCGNDDADSYQLSSRASHSTGSCQSHLADMILKGSEKEKHIA